MATRTTTVDVPVRLLTPQQVSDLTGLTIGTLAKARLLGRGPRFLKLGASVRYDLADVEQWIASHKRQRSTAESTGVESLTSPGSRR